MIGAICGDVIGSVDEFNNIKSRDFELFTPENTFTDDTVMTCAVAEALMKSWELDEFQTLEDVARDTLVDVGYWYPMAGYGRRFWNWIYREHLPYNSCGNGSAMRISAVGNVARTFEEAKRLAHAVTVISHNHPEGIKGAEAVAVAIYMAKIAVDKEAIVKHIVDHYGYEIKSVEEYHNETDGHGKEICQIAVPQALAAFREGTDYESVIRNCIYIGGDTDTTAAVAGGIAEEYFGVPMSIQNKARCYLDRRLRDIVDRFDVFNEMMYKECTHA